MWHWDTVFMYSPIYLINWGFLAYPEALQRQAALVGQVQMGQIPGALVLVEHPPVITIGRNSNPMDILVDRELLCQLGIEVYEVARGGGVTYHGPGQIVGYPILRLDRYDRDLHRYLWMLEEVLIRVLRINGLQGERMAGFTGVWVEGAKIAAIGIGAKGWVSMHGFALNIKPHLEHFALINPCGIKERVVTSMAQKLAKEMDVQKVALQIVDSFAQVFNVKFISERS